MKVYSKDEVQDFISEVGAIKNKSGNYPMVEFNQNDR